MAESDKAGAMREQQEPPHAPHPHDGPPDLRAELARLARDETAEITAGLARLSLDYGPDERHVSARLRNYFVAGLVVVGPVAITLYIASHFINSVDAWVRPYIPDIYNPNRYLPFPIPGVGLLFAIVGLTLIGALAANLLGRSLISAGEMVVGRTPIVRNVYQGLQQIFASMLVPSHKHGSLPKVALIEFPSQGIWSLGFVTGEAAKEFSSRTESGDLIGIFIAHGLLPPSGFTCFVPRKDVIAINMSVEDAARIIISAGMASPQRRRPKTLRTEEKPHPENRRGPEDSRLPTS
jgi:uncharacterized membrane protein